MLSSNNIKNFIVNPDVYLGSAAVRYFDDSLSEDEDILNIALDRCTSINEDEQLLLLGEVTNLKLNSESMNKIIKLLPNVSPKLRLMYGRLLTNANSVLLASANFDMKLLMPEIRIILNQKLQLPTYSTDELLKELLDLSEKNAEKYANEFDYKYGELIVEELSKRDNLDENKIISTLTDTEFDEYGYYESYLLTLAGKRKLKSLVPLFIDGLGESDLVSEEAMYSLMRLGTADIIQKLVERYPNEDEDFRIYASGIFENIKLIESEKAALKLLKEETDVTLKTLLAGALCQLFSAEAIPQIKELIQEGYDESMLNLEELAYINCIFNGLNIPEMELWKEGFNEEKDFFMSPPDLNLPVIAESKVGRNDPCPCGSGKKYKKCCGNA